MLLSLQYAETLDVSAQVPLEMIVKRSAFTEGSLGESWFQDLLMT